MYLFKKRPAGFTLIELLIVIAVIIFLMRLIMPKYQLFYRKAQQTEVSFNLSTLYAAQQAYYLEHGRYTTNLKALGWQPRGYTGNPETTQNAYTYGSAHAIDGNGEGVSFFTGSARASTALLQGSIVSGETYILKAATMRDGVPEVWSLSHTGDITQS